jgi:signal transduction histidine kinase
VKVLRPRDFVFFAAGALAYFLIGRLSLCFAFTQANASAVWLLSGLSIGALARFGPRYGVSVFLGSLVLNAIVARQHDVSAGTAWLSAVGIALGSVGEALLGAFFARRLFGSSPYLGTPRGVLDLFLWVALVPALVSTGSGIATLSATGSLPSSQWLYVASTWALGNVAGTLLGAPLFFSESWRGWLRARLHEWESLALFALLVLLVLTISNVHFSGWLERWPKSWLAVPFMLWIAIRLGRRSTTVAAMLIMFLGVAQTMGGRPVFSADTPEQSLLALQFFVIMVAALGLTVSMVAHQLALQRQAMEAVLASQDLLESMVMEETSTLVATAMHDLQSPLHGIRNLLQLARTRAERLSGMDREHLLAQMQASVDRMLTMVASTLGPLKTPRENSARVARCDLGELVRRAAETERAAAKRKGLILLIEELPEQPIFVVTESVPVEHVLGNFLSNAVKFSSPGACVSLTLSETEEEVQLSVTDEGPGISAEDRPHIFSGTLRGNGARPTDGEPSSGLGLFLSARLAERLQGRVSCEGSEGGGSVFSLWLPKVTSDSAAHVSR